MSQAAAKKAYADSRSLECHIALALIKRYMTGEDLPEAVLDDLQKHLTTCASCMAVAKGESKPFAAPKIDWTGLTAFIRHPRNIFMVVGLGCVLILMSTVLHNPTALLGPKASSALPSKDDDKTTPKTEDKASPATPETTKDTPPVDPKPAATDATQTAVAPTDQPSTPNVAVAASAFKQSATTDNPATPASTDSKTQDPKATDTKTTAEVKTSDTKAVETKPALLAETQPVTTTHVVEVSEHPQTTHTTKKAKAKAKPKTIVKKVPQRQESATVKSPMRIKRPTQKPTPQGASNVEIYDQSGHLISL